MKQVPSDSSQVVLFGDFEGFSPAVLFDYLTKPELLIKWWPPLVEESEPALGGSFVYRWPDQGWNLRGKFLAFEPGAHLSFSWCWDHEPVEHGDQTVDIWIRPFLDKGSEIGLFHKSFGPSEQDQEARQGVAEGWIHFMMRLAGLSDGDAE